MAREHLKECGMSPNAKTGTYLFSDVDSFCQYVNDHGSTKGTHIYADCKTWKVTAVLNDHGRGNVDEDDDCVAGWGDHRAILGLEFSDSWKRWTAKDRAPLSQADFADFLEDQTPDIATPPAADLLEVATTLHATTGANVKAATRLDNGQVQFRYEETIETRAGKSGTLTIPTRITLGLEPFVGSIRYQVEARRRYRISTANVNFTVILDRPEDVLRHAFKESIEKIAESIDCVTTVLLGSPAAMFPSR
jgi:uncharacterized protein YfdQ (DUF2303 family)